jgi:hypothetical protein
MAPLTQQTSNQVISNHLVYFNAETNTFLRTRMLALLNEYKANERLICKKFKFVLDAESGWGYINIHRRGGC